MVNELDFSKITETPVGHCRCCGTKFELCSGPTAPQAGDVSACINCAALTVFNADLTGRAPTPEEDAIFAKDERLKVLRYAIKATNAKRAGRLGDEPTSVQ